MRNRPYQVLKCSTWGTGTKALTSSLIRPARSSKPWSMGLRIGGQLPTYGRLRAGGTRAKGERMEGGDYACPFFFESIFFYRPVHRVHLEAYT